MMARRFNTILETILDTMDLPRQRVVPATLSNVQWLIRNMGIRNANVPNYGLAMMLLHKELKSLEEGETGSVR